MPLTTTASPRQLSDGNSDGTVLGQSITDLIGFFGQTPVKQPSDNSQAIIARGQQAGVITTYSTTQSPTAVTANTTVASSMTVQTGTGAIMLPAATDLFYINKPTAQAGLGVGNVYCSSSNTLNVSFSNPTGSTVTPTGSEVYKVVAIRGLPFLTPTLSPVAVAADSVIEQQFTVTGVPNISGGTILMLNKPTNQAGLDIVGMRVVSSNVIGITYANFTASPITPTSEAYTIYALGGLDAVNNDVNYGFNVGTVGAIGAGLVVSGGSTTLTGVLSTDQVLAASKPTSGAAATNTAYPALGIPTANTLTLYFAGIGTGATPTASEVYAIATRRLNPVAPLLRYQASLAPVAVAANTTAEQTFNVTGLVAGSPVWINKPSWTSGLGITGVRVSAANTLAITYCNVTSASITPPTETYTIGNFQVPAPGAGNSVYQTVSPVMNATTTLANALRASTTSLGLIAGA